jgi:hypothetical protein
VPRVVDIPQLEGGEDTSLSSRTDWENRLAARDVAERDEVSPPLLNASAGTGSHPNVDSCSPREDHRTEPIVLPVENEKATRQKVTSSFKGE